MERGGLITVGHVEVLHYSRRPQGTGGGEDAEAG